VIAGQGTIGMEIAAIPATHPCYFCGDWGGGLISGIAAYETVASRNQDHWR